ncbi:hypothetical protein RMA95_10180 [Acinetobacter sp. V110_1]|uniref:hypothetical protein n=1 Tax=Acinetobacter sp. V110_1 TaxID=3072988 RepID=UPI00287E4214|nr:hypothetical protein [Acinetobacter sp. V110_1]MDS7944271.1 hypothetical protein [Acinetobacter sp. V110_1]
MTNFVDVLNEMEEHYINNINTGMEIPYYHNLIEDSLGLVDATNKYCVTDVNNDGEATDNSFQSKLNALKNKAQDTSTHIASLIEEELKKSSKKLKDNNSPAAKLEFDAALDKIGESAIEDATKNIKKIIANAKEIGKAFPGAQNLILIAVQKINQLINELILKIVAYISELVKNIIKWIEKAWDAIVKTFNDIRIWISHWF